MQKRWRSKKRGIPEGSNFSLSRRTDGVTETVHSLSEEKKKEEERRKEREEKKTGRDRTELRFHKKAPRALLSRICPHEHVRGSTVVPSGPTIEESRGSPPREAPPNSGSYTRGRIVASPPIGRHVARHCFIHACCTFLVYLVQVAPGPGLEPALLRPGPRSSFLRPAI